MIVFTHPEAEQELIDGAQRYKRQVNARLGAAFVAEYERVVAQLLRYPHFGSIWRGPLRHYPLRRFPYTVIHHVSGDAMRILAVAHQSRKPGYWAGRT